MKLKKKSLIILLLILIFSSIISSYIIHKFCFKDILIYDMDLEVKREIGINIDTDAFHFGGLRPGGSSERQVSIRQEYDFPVLVNIKTKGEMADLVSVSENNFVLEPGESKTVTFTAKVGKETSYGNYTGNVIFEFRRALFSG